eukprot:gnl/Hemi2/25465_TR8563_c0_g1_i2.p1 gnl/Hemi2/25465_TR8563_c0_g1~~gnl/Hemi2/25465_TR8563_c0_g1_i2.p1  ORF type:complete len:167 (-),score=31.50 gnl/Hemi2/25465_TR8563_c0_g1_i2:306-806(-)
MSMRAWSEFFDTKCFKIPEASHYMARVTTNLEYFKANYLAVLGLLFLYASYYQPALLVTVAIAAVLVYLSRTAPEEYFVIGGRRLSRRERYFASITIGLLLIVILTGWVLFWVLGLSALVALVHASARSRPVGVKMSTWWNSTWNSVTGKPSMESVLMDELGDEDE